MRKNSRRACAAFAALALILCCMTGFIFGASAADEKGSLTLWCVKDEDIVANMHWQIYRVGHRSSNDYVFDGDFAGYRATLGDRTKPMLEWDTKTVAAAGDALKFKTIADEIPFLDEGKTNEQGSVTFDGLTDGLYLVWGDTLRVGNTTYVPSAIFFANDCTIISHSLLLAPMTFTGFTALSVDIRTNFSQPYAIAA